jgi:queuine/archaeosine tRNA-ribosyltransferase
LNQVKEKQFVLGLAGLGKIEDIVHGLKFGISIFEVNYPFILAEEQKALIRNGDGTYS